MDLEKPLQKYLAIFEDISRKTKLLENFVLGKDAEETQKALDILKIFHETSLNLLKMTEVGLAGLYTQKKLQDAMKHRDFGEAAKILKEIVELSKQHKEASRAYSKNHRVLTSQLTSLAMSDTF